MGTTNHSAFHLTNLLIMKILFCILSLMVALGSRAQTDPFVATETEHRAKTNVRMNLVWPGINAEFAVGKDVSLVADFSVGGFGRIDGDGFFFNQTTAQVRYYFDNTDRMSKNESIDNFTGDYLAVGAYHFRVLSPTTFNMTNIGFAWGRQKTYRNRIYQNFSIGPTVLIIPEGMLISIWADYTLGINLFRR